MSTTVVILGAGWAGLPLAHKLLKYTLPKLPQLKVILVSPNDHFFWNVAATRGIIPGEIPDPELFVPIGPAFKQYPAESFELVLGKAAGLDQAGNVVSVRLNTGSEWSIVYNHLVVATGSRLTSGLPLKLLDSYEATLSAWHDLQREVGAAKSIIVAGGGATGVEVAGELAARYQAAKQITLVIDGDEPLPTASSSVRATLTRDLQKLGVTTVTKTRVAGADKNAETGRWTITTNNARIQADLYLPLFGITVNSSFLPRQLLDDSGSLRLSPDMRVMGTDNVWGIGDIGNLEAKQLTVIDAQIIHLATALDTVLTTSNPAAPYRPNEKKMIFLSLGRKHATGQIGNWKLWGFMVNYVKGRRLFVDTAKGYVHGQHLRHAKM
ncbi:hypothetical protein S40288_06687 [Stachybotrys chartarum IBT 40288]|nr:hypothetical protein S40288_06687 [Stachybotrys chartarum IBT 40288]